MADQRLQETSRFAYMDLLRCGALYLVVLLHCINYTLTDPSLVGTLVWWLCDILNSAARMGVPLFFMISGALLLPDRRTLEPLSFYAKRLGRLLLPFLCWDILYFLENAYLQAQPPRLEQFFVELLTARGSKFHLWFVYKIVSIYLLLPFLKRILDHCHVREGLILLTVILLQPSILPLINLLPGIEIDLFGPPIDGRVGFFVLGWLLTRQDLPAWVRRMFYIGAVPAFLLNILGNGWLSAPGRLNFWFNDGCALTHFFTAGAVFLLAKEHLRLSGRPAALFRRVSDLSYGIYLAHALFLECLVWLLRPMGLGTALTNALCFAATSVTATAFIWLVAKVKPLGRLLAGTR